jgi:hypothetical protein
MSGKILNPEAVGDPEQTPIVEVPDDLAEMLIASGQCTAPFDERDELRLVALEGLRNERELRECIRQAAALSHDWLVTMHHVPQKDLATAIVEHQRKLQAWLALRAVTSAIALEAADRGER